MLRPSISKHCHIIYIPGPHSKQYTLKTGQIIALNPTKSHPHDVCVIVCQSFWVPSHQAGNVLHLHNRSLVKTAQANAFHYTCSNVNDLSSFQCFIKHQPFLAFRAYNHKIFVKFRMYFIDKENFHTTQWYINLSVQIKNETMKLAGI